MNFRIKEWLKQSRVDTPILVIDLEIVRQKYHELTKAFEGADCYYAVKANPRFDILRRLAKEGSGFYVSSPAELEKVMQTGVDPLKIAYTHPIKKSADIAYAWQHGVRLFAFDTLEELEKIAKNAPYSNILCRLNLSHDASQIGCSITEAESLILKAKQLGLNPMGLSFHLGSMQKDCKAYIDGLMAIEPLYNRLKAQNIVMEKINIGGGFPVHYSTENADIYDYGKKISQKAKALFGKGKLMVEPGRLLVAEAGLMAASVILVSHKNNKPQIHIEIGFHNGLKEAQSRHIHYPIEAYHETSEILQSYFLYGPEGQKLYDDIQLPQNLKEGDKIHITHTGAYSVSATDSQGQAFMEPRMVCLPVAEDMPLFAKKVVNLSDARMERKKSLWG